MKKATLFLCGTLLLTGLGIEATARFGNTQPSQTGTAPPMDKFTTVSQLMLDKCMACHSRDYDLPFYAQIPGIKEIIQKDFTDGLRAMDLNRELVDVSRDSPVSEATLAKMEWVTLNETMPPAKFTAVHWGSRLSQKDRTDILGWVRETRARHYATGLAAQNHANEPLQPLPAAVPFDAKKAALGEKLFNDTRLSADNTLSCASCHLLDKAGTDSARFATGIRDQKGDINTPTVFNAVFNVSQFWNGRAANLQEQADGPPFNPIEMGSADWAEILGRINQDSAFVAEFTAVYPEGLSGKTITHAIAEYEKTLITPGSRFDKWLMGDDMAITKQELKGYERFKQYRCVGCHVGKSAGGQSFEYLDLKKDYFVDRGDPLGSDAGLKGFTGKDEDLHRFKVPTLRNVELTAPYLHDGVPATLDETVRIMGIYLSGLEVPQGDRELITAFLRTLTGQFEGKPVQGVAVEK